MSALATADDAADAADEFTISADDLRQAFGLAMCQAAERLEMSEFCLEEDGIAVFDTLSAMGQMGIPPSKAAFDGMISNVRDEMPKEGLMQMINMAIGMATAGRSDYVHSSTKSGWEFNVEEYCRIHRSTMENAMTELKWSDEDKELLRNKYRGVSVREVHDYHETKGHNENTEVDYSKPIYKATCDTNGIKVPSRTMQVSFGGYEPEKLLAASERCGFVNNPKYVPGGRARIPPSDDKEGNPFYPDSIVKYQTELDKIERDFAAVMLNPFTGTPIVDDSNPPLIVQELKMIKEKKKHAKKYPEQYRKGTDGINDFERFGEGDPRKEEKAVATDGKKESSKPSSASTSKAAASTEPLNDFDAWLEQVGAPKMWINTTVSCVALLAEELTGFRPQDYGIDQFPSAPGRNWSTAVYDYYRDSKQGWLDDRYTGVKGSKTGVSACPGIGDSTAKALANVGIYTTRDLINKFNSFSGLSIKPKYN